MVEAAELLRLFQWGRGESLDSDVSGLRAQAAEELADVQLYVLSLATLLDVDLEAATRAKLDKNRTRWPAVPSAGGPWVDRPRNE